MFDEQKPAGCWRAIVPILVIGLLVVYGAVAVGAGDPFFFMGGVSGEVSEAIVYDHGRMYVIKPGGRGFDQIVKTTHEQLPKVVAAPPIGTSNVTVDGTIRKKNLALELRYKSKGFVHSNYNIGSFDRLIIPLDGVEAQDDVYFTAYIDLDKNEVWVAKAPQLQTESMDRIRRVISDAGY